MVLEIPAGFELDLFREGSASVGIALNAEQGVSAGLVRAYATRIIRRHAAELGPLRRSGVVAAVTTPAARRNPPRIDVRSRGWYNAAMDYKHYMVPGILVALVTLIGTLMTAQNIARERELGTLEQLNVTPLTRRQFIAGKLLPFWILAMVELAIGLGVARLLFGIPMRGSLLLVFGAAAIYLVVALGLGLLISTVAETQQQAMFVTFFVMMVYLLMSGLYTPIDSMPEWVRWLAELNPVKHFVEIMRAILVKGAGPREIARPLLALFVFGAGVLLLAVRRHVRTHA
jgi:ABC-2 type transport system permease protein